MGLPLVFARAAAFSRGCQLTNPTGSSSLPRFMTAVTMRKRTAAMSTHSRTGERRDCDCPGVAGAAGAGGTASILSIGKLPAAEDHERRDQGEDDGENPPAGCFAAPSAAP